MKCNKRWLIILVLVGCGFLTKAFVSCGKKATDDSAASLTMKFKKTN